MGGAEESARVYVGNLPDTCSPKDVEAEFQKFGKLTSCELKKNVGGAAFAFLEFEDPRDARDAIKEKDGADFLGKRLRVETPFGSKDDGRGNRRRGPGPPRRGRYLIEVTGLPPSGSWQDLKDHMREAGECAHADVFRGGVGEVSFYSRSDMEYAIDKFDGSTFKSHEGEKAKIRVREWRPNYRSRSRSGSHHRRRRSHGRERERSRRSPYSRGRSIDRSREREREHRHRSRSDSYGRRR
ncbi:splicing factor, arginine/serine-rich 3, putative [Babesia bigemina]|uniref:Splicing factor, arginine/serine-rich 3, putative n=1 Tax=Babesia bigemina TaxID=5866 RepID=A0A061D4Y8_BABBI|nr:splicing factor, arginine/serine-rich 3, putative [Babesia bigemina]CDR95112.1 splicing factor, arginine/serine-rich 3, putative [Babesia bigemina]|eukprot:XP_012767298.1 splicing factor, arginine/serine-rich 3, putative [Babesia bigemina]